MTKEGYYPEPELLGSGKHGINWTEGPARAMNPREKSDTQGQFRSLQDIYFAIKKGAELGPDCKKGATFPLPHGHSSIVYVLENGKVVTKPAVNVFVKTYPVDHQGRVRIHAFPRL